MKGEVNMATNFPTLIEDHGNHLLMTDYYNQYHGILKENVDFEGSHLYNRTEGQFLSGLKKAALAPLTLKVTEEGVWDANHKASAIGARFPAEMFMRIVKELDGNVPIKFQMLPEGTWCPIGTPFSQVRNTVEDFGELNTWWEPLYMMSSFDTGCNTRAYHMYKYLQYLSKRFNLSWDTIKVLFHSFGFRGHRSIADAIKAARAWSSWLYGSDDLHVLNSIPLTADIGSIPAAGHKVTQQFDDELAGIRHGIDALSKLGEAIVAYPIDTYNPHKFIAEKLSESLIYAHHRGMHFVGRPDSGDCVNQVKQIYDLAVRQSRHKNVSTIIGEKMSFQNAVKVIEELIADGIPVNFNAYGIGSGFYNDINRDTHGWAMKTAYSNRANRMKFSADTFKRSIPGFIDIVEHNNELMVVPEGAEGALYETIYEFDPNKGHKEPVFTPYDNQKDWQEAFDRSHKADSEGKTKQERIFLHADIISEIETFRKKYQ